MRNACVFEGSGAPVRRERSLRLGQITHIREASGARDPAAVRAGATLWPGPLAVARAAAPTLQHRNEVIVSLLVLFLAIVPTEVDTRALTGAEQHARA